MMGPSGDTTQDRAKYRKLTRQVALRAGIDPDIFVSMIAWESMNFDPRVVSGEIPSSEGALGIAQIIPRWHPDVNPLEPEEALLYAASFQKAKLSQYQGDTRRAVLSWMIPQAVEELTQKYGSAWEQHLPEVEHGQEGVRYLAEILGPSKLQPAAPPTPPPPPPPPMPVEPGTPRPAGFIERYTGQTTIPTAGMHPLWGVQPPRFETLVPGWYKAYPTFGSDLDQSIMNAQQAQAEVQGAEARKMAAERKVKEVQVASIPYELLYGAGFGAPGVLPIIPGGPGNLEALSALAQPARPYVESPELTAAKAEFTQSVQAAIVATDRFDRLSWRVEFNQWLPQAVVAKDEVVDLNTALRFGPQGPDLTQEDINWAAELWAKAEPLRRKPVTTTTELAGLLEAPPTVQIPVTISQLTVAEIKAGLVAGMAQPVFKLPPTMSPTEFRDVLRLAGYSDEEADKQINDIATNADRLVSEYQTSRNSILRYKAGLQQATIPELTTGEFLKGVLWQPGMIALEKIGWYNEMVVKPLTFTALTVWGAPRPGPWWTDLINPPGLLLRGLQAWRSEQYASLENQWQKAMSEGFTDWEARRVAWNQLESVGGFEKFMFECAFDPINLLPIIGWVAKPIPIVGKGIILLVRTIDLPFDGMRWLAGLMPKSVNAKSRSFAQSAVNELIKATRALPEAKLSALAPGLFGGLRVPASAIRDLANTVYSQGQATDLGKALQAIALRWIDVNDMVRWATKLAGPDAFTNFSRTAILDLNDAVVLLVSNKTNPIAKSEAVARVLDKLQVDPTDANIRRMGELLGDWLRTGDDRVAAVFAPEQPKQIFRNLYQEAHDAMIRLENSRITTQRYQRAVVGTIGNTTDLFTRTIWQGFLESKIVMPFARHVLMFTMYGFPNFVESLGRAASAGVYAWKPMGRSISARDAWAMLVAGSKSATFRDLQGSGAEGALLMAPMASTGETVISEMAERGIANIPRGRVPGVTTPIQIPSFMPGVGGRTVHMPFTHWTSLAHMNQSWGRLSSEVEAGYKIVQLSHVLWEKFPEQMGRIADARPFTLDPKLIKTPGLADRLNDFRKMVEHFAPLGPDPIREMVTDIATLEGRLVAADVVKTLGKLPSMPAPVANAIVDDITRHGLPANLEEWTQRVATSIWDARTVGLASKTKRLEDFAHQLSGVELVTKEDYLGFLKTLNELNSEILPDSITDAQATMVIAGQGLSPEAQAKHYAYSRGLIDNYHDVAIDRMDKLSQLFEDVLAKREQPTIDWNAIPFVTASGRPQSSALKAELVEMLNKLPVEMRFGLTKIQINARACGATAGGSYNSATRVISIRSREALRNQHTLFHELTHDLAFGRVEKNDLELFNAFVDAYTQFFDGLPLGARVRLGEDVATPAQLREGLGHGLTNAAYGSYVSVRAVHESLASMGASYLQGVPYRLQILQGGQFFNSPPISVPPEVSNAITKFFDAYFPRKLNRLPITDQEAQLGRDLVGVWRDRHRTLQSTLHQVWEAYDAHFNTALRTDHAHMQSTRGEVNRLWSQWKATNAEVHMAAESRLLAAIQPIANLPKPPTSVGPISAATVAYIFRGNADDLSRSLFDPTTYTIRGKDSFRGAVKGRAVEVGRPFGLTPDDMGFTDEAINRVYDDLVSGAGIDPRWAANDQYFAPILKELDGLRQEMYRIKSTKGIHPDDHQLINDYLTEYADNLDKLPMFRPPTPEAAQAIIPPITPRPPAGEAVEVIAKLEPETAVLRTLADIKREAERLPDYGLALIGVNDLAKALGMKMDSDEFAAVIGRLVQGGTARCMPARTMTPRNSIWMNFEAGRLWNKATDRAGVGVHIRFVEYLPPKAPPTVARAAAPLAAAAIPPITPPPAPPIAAAGATEWAANRDEAIAEVYRRYYLDFVDRDNQTIADDVMHGIAPYWSYESQRWPWLARTAIKRPGVVSAWGRYESYTDQGYITVPGTDIQLNPLRGFVFMGGFIRAQRRDYPEFADRFPLVSQAFDQLARYGFYPNILVTGAMSIVGAASPLTRPQLGDLLPAWVSTPINAYLAVHPDSQVAAMLREVILPSYFRDYLTIIAVEDAGGDGELIWAKKRYGQTLTDEEQAMWNRGSGIAAQHQILAEQSGMSRYRPEERKKAWDLMAQLRAEVTGIPEETYRTLAQRQWLTGNRPEDILPGLDPLDRQVLREIDLLEKWSGRSTIVLEPSKWQDENAKIIMYWNDVLDLYERARGLGVEIKEGDLAGRVVGHNYLEQELRSGRLSPADWVRQSNDLQSATATASREMGKIEFYKDVPKTLAERLKRLQEHGVETPAFDPIQELLWLYYELEPKHMVNEDTGVLELDLDTYYQSVDTLLEHIPPDLKSRFMEVVQYHWTDTQKLYWQTSHDYLRPYRNIRQLLLAQYLAEEQATINRFYRASTSEREQLREVEATSGRKLISEFESRLSGMRERARQADPEMDAWLCFWQKTQKRLTPQADSLFREVESRLLTK